MAISASLRRTTCAAALVVSSVTAPVSAGENVPSGTLANKLASLMEAQKLEAVAAEDPTVPGRFVAALLIPGVQVLVVAAQYPNPAELQALLAQKSYRDVYTALHQPAAQASRFFYIDSGCDGVHEDGTTVDILYEKGTNQTLFNGNWKEQKLSEDTYKKRVQTAETEYVKLVAILTQLLSAGPAAQ